MLLKEIYDTEMQLMNKYRRNYAYNDNTNSYGREASMDYVLRFWNEEKVNLFKLLGNKLMYSEVVSFEAPKAKLMEDMHGMVWSHAFADIVRRTIDNTEYLDWDVRHAFRCLFDSEFLVDNKYQGESVKMTFNGKTIQLQNGAKPLRILAKIAAALEEEVLFEDFRLKHSQILNVKELHGELVLSIHPLDYMTMSDNASGWSSCMSWEETGCYRRGTVEMMNSPYAVVAYLKADKDMYMGNDLYWNNKKWRTLCLATENFITSVKAYPYKSDALSTKAVEILARLAKANLGWDFDEKVIKYDACDDVCITEGEETLRYTFGFETDAMYNDFDSGVTSHIVLAKGLEPKHYWLNYSGVGNCMCCGNIEDFGDGDYDSDCEGILVCDVCSPCIRCDRCSRGVYDDHDLIEVDGEWICTNCYENETAEAVDDEEIHFHENMTQVYLAPSVPVNMDSTYNWNYIWLYNTDMDTLERFTTTCTLHKVTRGWREMKYILMSEMTDEAAEHYGVDYERGFINYYERASLNSDQSWEKWKAERDGREWLVDKPDNWDEIAFNAREAARDFFYPEVEED